MQIVQDVTDLERAIGAVLRELPPERAREVLDFAQWLKERAVQEETALAAEDAKWDAAFSATDPKKLRAWLAEDEAEIASGETLSMFDDDERWLVDDQISAAQS